MVYLDYAATTPLLPEVRGAMRRAEEVYFANASALHTPGHLALMQIEECRELLAEMVGCRADEIIFTSGASEANNTVLNSFRGHEIECSPYEHHSIIEAAKVYRGDKLPKLYSYMLANNELGDYVWKLKGAGGEQFEVVCDNGSNLASEPRNDGRERSGPRIAHRRAYLHSDLTQVLGKIPVDVKALGLDYATFSAHKIGGPVGVGALYVREGAPFAPLIIGGNQEKKRRGGTYNTVGIVGFLAALKFAKEHRTWEQYDTRVRALRDALAERILKEVPGSSLNTNLEAALPNILNMSFAAAEGESIQLYLDAEGVVVSTGSACAAGDIRPSHVLMAKSGGDAEVAHSSIRFSFGLDNTMEDVDRVMEVLPGIVHRLQQISTVQMKSK